MTDLVNEYICVCGLRKFDLHFHSHKIHQIYCQTFKAYFEVSGVFLILTSPLLLLQVLLVAFLREGAEDDED